MTEKSLNGEAVGVVAADTVRVKSPVTATSSTAMLALATASPRSAGADRANRPLATPQVPPQTGTMWPREVVKSSLISVGPALPAAGSGRTASDTADAGPFPSEFEAVTVNRYA